MTDHTEDGPRLLAAWPVTAQVVGGLAVLAGLYLLLGLAATLLVGGAALVALGALREGGRI